MYDKYCITLTFVVTRIADQLAELRTSDLHLIAGRRTNITSPVNMKLLIGGQMLFSFKRVKDRSYFNTGFIIFYGCISEFFIQYALLPICLDDTYRYTYGCAYAYTYA
ncbi:hypothetical protein GQX74_012703 [Glossina fuscipes]|nr:hypothetical protein GQX74_012703 [Glossina fuscipes]